MKRSGAQIVMDVLLEQGVAQVFGYPGGTALQLYEALYERQDSIHHYLTADEQGATHAADGYARATGKTGVVIATSGPGATNTVTGIATAYMDSIPLVVITANVGRDLIGKDSFQEVYIAGITQPITKHNFVVRDITQLADTIRAAFSIAQSGRKGPVLVDIPKDITIAMGTYTKAGPVATDPPPPVEQAEMQQIAELINGSERPVLCFGGGIISGGASEELLELAQKANLPACHTIMGTGVMGFGEKLDLGLIGMHGSIVANRAIDGSDLLLAVGTRFSDRVALNCRKFAPHAKIVQIDIDPCEIQKNVSADVAVIGDTKLVLKALLPMVTAREREDWLYMLDIWRGMEPSQKADDGSFHPQDIMEVIAEVAGENAIIVTDVGQHQMWAAQYCKRTKPRGFITSGGLGTMGFGYGAAIGAKVAHPDVTVIHITGDGSFHMNMNEACTAVSYGLGIVTVILDNGVLGMVRQWQTTFYDRHYMATSPERKTDYVKLAEGFGLKGYRAESREAFFKGLTEALALEKPAWIVCPVDQDERVLPMIPAGQTVQNLIMK